MKIVVVPSGIFHLSEAACKLISELSGEHIPFDDRLGSEATTRYRDTQCRSDLFLVHAVEQLGYKAGFRCRLEVVEIEKGREFVIKSEDYPEGEYVLYKDDIPWITAD